MSVPERSRVLGVPHSPYSRFQLSREVSSGIAHETKSKIELGVAGKDGLFDDIKVWNAEPAKR